MFSIADQQPNHHCQGKSRREFLRAGGLGFGAMGALGVAGVTGGLSLPSLLAAKASAAEAGLSRVVRDRAVVLLFLHGGPPHIEFFDPKMTAPDSTRSLTGEIKTTLPGVTFGSTFPKLARRADKLAIVRSYGSRNGSHTYQTTASGRNPTKATMSAIYARVAGTNNARTGLPSNVIIKPEAVQPGLKLGSNFETNALPGVTDPGNLGPSYRAFDPSGAGELKQNMRMQVTPDRLADRKSLLAGLDHMRRGAEKQGGIENADRFTQQAFDIISRGVGEAFDLSKESAATLQRYDTRPLFDDKELQRWYDMRRATNKLGLQMLMARRMVEAGCGFVTVSDCGWDYHANKNSPRNMAGIHPMGGQVDHAVAAFIDDLEERGLSDKVLLLVTGEMGRTPKLNNNGGRNHYGDLTSLLAYSGALNMGQVIGQSDALAAKPATRPYGPEHLLATVMHFLFDMGELRVQSNLPRDLIQVANAGQPIDELF